MDNSVRGISDRAEVTGQQIRSPKFFNRDPEMELKGLYKWGFYRLT